MQTLSSQQRVEAVLAAAGISFDIRTFPDGTRTALEAATAIGCSVGEIAKSIVLRAVESGRVVVVVVSGRNRVDMEKVADLLDQSVIRADAEFVRRHTGFAIGGVAPVGHLEAPLLLLDRDLLHYRQVWAAAGTSDSVFRISPAQLQQLLACPVVDIKQE